MTAQEYAARRRQVAGSLASRRLDALVVSSPANIRYLCGYAGSNGLLLLFSDRAVFFTDPRYPAKPETETPFPLLYRVVTGPLFTALAGSIGRKVRRLGFESPHLTHDSWLTLRRHLPGGVTLVPGSGWVEASRMIKSAAEMERMRRSAATNSRAFSRSLRFIRPGITESALAAEIDYRMRRLGAEQPAFETIVAAGERSALPHSSPGPMLLSRDQLVLIDMGACQDGYASDMTRMVFLGRPGAKVRLLYSAVLEAQLEALSAVREGVKAAEVDGAARKTLRRHKLDEAFVHSTGHGLGLEIHEAPRIGRKVDTLLQAGMAITIEPGVYLQGFGGIRIEDTVIVTRTGFEILTQTPKELLAL